MPLNPKLQKFTTTSPVLASFDSTDIADGTGTVEYKGAHTKLTTNDNYLLTRSPIFSNKIETNGSINSASLTKVIDIDFDLTKFNSHRIINGTGILTVPTAIRTGGPTYTRVIIAKLYKVSGTTTELVSATSETQGASISDERVLALQLVIPRTTFKKGDFLRLKIEGWIQRITGSVAGTMTIAHDPQNRDGVTITPSSQIAMTTKLLLTIPFELINL